MYKDQVILVTGGTGSWGQELTRHLLEQEPQEIRIFSRNEYTQVMMQRSLTESQRQKVRFWIGDVRDQEAVDQVMKGVDLVFHLAALKHVPVCEWQPEEALKTNVKGTENLIKSAIAHRVPKFVDVSTDKAVDPINFYGMTKAFGEKLTIRANRLSEYTRFVCIRGGNVLGTNGSVVPFFKKLLQERKPLPLTSEEMTRFFLTIKDAIRLLLKAAEVSHGGEIFVMKMKSCEITDLIHCIADQLGIEDVQIQDVGIRPGEKIHEVLVSAHEAGRCYIYDEEYFVVLPEEDSQLLPYYQHLSLVNFSKYDSSQTKMSMEELNQLLVRGGIFP